MRLASFVRTYLSPADRIAEIVCGLVMVLTFTLTAGLAVTETGGARELLVAAFGCNVAWGIIDGVAYVMAQLVARGRRAARAEAIRDAPSREAALRVIAAVVDENVEAVMDSPQREALYRGVHALALATPAGPPRVTRDDLLGALAILAIDLACTLPAALPFLIFGDHRIALRVSNALLVGALFVAGYQWGAYGTARPWRAGAALASLGLALVGVAILLGG